MSTPAAYAYRALRADGTIARGRVDAPSPTGARAALEQAGLLALELQLVIARDGARRSIPAGDLALGLRMLAELMQAGLPLARALRCSSEVTPKSWQPLLASIEQAVREGSTLGAALRSAPVVIPPLVVGMVVAGEATGDVASTVRRAAEVTESLAATRAAIRAALAYPIVLAVVGTATIATMVGVVIPRFATILADVGQTLPASTRLVLGAAATARDAFVPLLVAGLVAAVMVRAWTATAVGRRRWHAALRRAPLIGTVRHASATSRTTLTLATLLESGVPLRQALPLAARAGGDADVEQRIIAAASRVESGQPIAAAFAETRALTPVAIKLVKAGEQSGRLAAMLHHVSRLEQDRADRITRSAVRLLEPALILAFAGVVALVAAALLQAVYSVRPVP